MTRRSARTAARLLADLGLLDAEPTHAARAMLDFCARWDHAVGRRSAGLVDKPRGLLARAQDGDTTALRDLLQPHSPTLTAIVDDEFARTLATWQAAT